MDAVNLMLIIKKNVIFYIDFIINSLPSLATLAKSGFLKKPKPFTACRLSEYSNLLCRILKKSGAV